MTQYPNSNTYTLYLTTPIKSVSTLRVIMAKVPNTFDNITVGSNLFTFNGVNYSILPGFFSAYGLATAMINTTNGQLGVQYLDDQGMFIFSASSAFTISFNTTELQSRVGILTGATLTGTLGSLNPVYKTDPVYASLYILLSTQVVNLNTTECAFLDVEEFRNNNVVDSRALNTAYNQSYAGTSVERIISVVPITVDSGKVQSFLAASNYSMMITLNTPVQNLQRVTVRWIDKDGKLLNFNGYNNNSFLIEING